MKYIDTWIINKLAFAGIPLRLLILSDGDFRAQWNLHRRYIQFTTDNVAASISALLASGKIFSPGHNPEAVVQYIHTLKDNIRAGEDAQGWPLTSDTDDIVMYLTSEGISYWQSVRCYAWDSHVEYIALDNFIEEDTTCSVGLGLPECVEIIAASSAMAERVLLDPFFYLGQVIADRGAPEIEHLASHDVTYWKTLQGCVRMRLVVMQVNDIDVESVERGERFADELRRRWFHQSDMDLAVR